MSSFNKRAKFGKRGGGGGGRGGGGNKNKNTQAGLPIIEGRYDRYCGWCRYLIPNQAIHKDGKLHKIKLQNDCQTLGVVLSDHFPFEILLYEMAHPCYSAFWVL